MGYYDVCVCMDVARDAPHAFDELVHHLVLERRLSVAQVLEVRPKRTHRAGAPASPAA